MTYCGTNLEYFETVLLEEYFYGECAGQCLKQLVAVPAKPRAKSLAPRAPSGLGRASPGKTPCEDLRSLISVTQTYAFGGFSDFQVQYFVQTAKPFETQNHVPLSMALQFTSITLFLSRYARTTVQHLLRSTLQRTKGILGVQADPSIKCTWYNVLVT